MCQVGCSKKSEDDKKKRNKYRSLSLWVGRWFGIVKRGASAGRKKGSGHEKGEGVVIARLKYCPEPGRQK